MKLLKFVLFFCLSVNCFATGGDLYDDITLAIRSGDAHQIATYFDAKVDLSISNQEDVYSKAQAELLIKDFFSKNTPKTFNLVHRGSSKEGTLFAVGTLTTSNGKTFRVSFVMKSAKGSNSIQELRFESQ